MSAKKPPLWCLMLDSTPRKPHNCCNTHDAIPHAFKANHVVGHPTLRAADFGQLHRAIHQWLAAQNDQQCYFMIVDLHSLTVQQDPEQLRQQCYSALALYLACGLDHQQHPIFMQSQVAAHSELMWLLSCLTGMGELQRMTQFKDKSAKHQHNINAGLLTYPVLMAADILLYQPTHVPVGDDQKQHLELARQLAQRFNHHFGELFVIPEPVIPHTGARIMGLQTPRRRCLNLTPLRPT